MRTLAFALCAAAMLSACAHGQDPAPAPALEITDPIRHALQPISVSAELADSAAPAVFEQTLCNRLFALNKKQVMCSDEVKVYIENKRQTMVMGQDDGTFEEVLKTLDAPRRVNLIAAKAGEAVSITVIVQDQAGATLDRFQITVKPDGADVFERAEEAAVKILSVK